VDRQRVHQALQQKAVTRVCGSNRLGNRRAVMAKALAHFTITRTGEEYLLLLEDEDGDTIEFTADFDQLDQITEAIDEQLSLDDDDALDADEDEDEEEEE
jgi:hypothetical protein